MNRLWDRLFAQTVDKLDIELKGSLALMENAGKAAYDEITKIISPFKKIIVLVGPGNNGGDGLVISRHLLKNYSLKILFINHSHHLSPSCLTQKNNLLSYPGTIAKDYSKGDLSALEDIVIIDSILGIGFKGSIRDGQIQDVLKEASLIKNKTVIAIDVPTGLDIDNCEYQDIPLKADYTVTFGGLKPALAISPARGVCGKIIVKDIGFSKESIDKSNAICNPLFKTAPMISSPFNKLSQDSHKYDRGHVLVLGGSRGKSGAPVLSAISALKSGAGWASVSFTKDTFKLPLCSFPLDITLEDFFTDKGLDNKKLESFLYERHVKSIILGPGSITPFIDDLTLKVLKRFSDKGGFIVFDAGVLANIAELMLKTPLNPLRTILTPHPGEWKKLCNSTVLPPLNLKGINAAKDFSSKLGTSLVYKGATPVFISAYDECAFFSNSGNNSLAKAGSGDVLSGIIGAGGAAGLESKQAFFWAYGVLSQSVNKASKIYGNHGVIASNIIENL